jgi:hypothetical protein
VLAASLLLVNSSLSDTWPLVHRKYREIDICFLEVFLAYLLICRPGVPCRKLFNKSLYSGITCVREMATAICQPRRANPDHLTSTSTVTRIMALTQDWPLPRHGTAVESQSQRLAGGRASDGVARPWEVGGHKQTGSNSSKDVSTCREPGLKLVLLMCTRPWTCSRAMYPSLPAASPRRAIAVAIAVYDMDMARKQMPACKRGRRPCE